MGHNHLTRIQFTNGQRTTACLLHCRKQQKRNNLTNGGCTGRSGAVVRGPWATGTAKLYGKVGYGGRMLGAARDQ